MNKILIILFISTILSCKEEYSVQILDLNTIPLELIKTEKQTMQEIQNPSSMHFFNNHIVFINTENNTDVPFYIYSTDSLNYIQRFGKFGRGPQEIFSYNPNYWDTTDSSFIINTNHYYSTEITFSKDSFHISRPLFLSNIIMNNLLRINDSLIIFDSKRENKEFSIYNTNKREIIKGFSKFPKATIPYKSKEDRDNILQKSCVINRDSQIIIAFYIREPLIRIFNFASKLIKEIRLKDIHQKNISLTEFYNNEENIYFLLPTTTQHHVFVLFINKDTQNSFLEETTELQKWDWNENLIKRYKILEPVDLYCISNDAKVFYG